MEHTKIKASVDTSTEALYYTRKSGIQSVLHQRAKCRNIFFPHYLYIVYTTFNKIDRIVQIIHKHRTTGFRQGVI